MKFKNMKFVVRDKRHSQQIQEALFALGYKWYLGNKIQYLDSSYLYTNRFGVIQHGTGAAFFERDSGTLSTLSDICNTTENTPFEVDCPAQTTITIGGNLYLVSDVENALKNLNKIGE